MQLLATKCHKCLNLSHSDCHQIQKAIIPKLFSLLLIPSSSTSAMSGFPFTGFPAWEICFIYNKRKFSFPSYFLCPQVIYSATVHSTVFLKVAPGCLLCVGSILSIQTVFLYVAPYCFMYIYPYVLCKFCLVKNFLLSKIIQILNKSFVLYYYHFKSHHQTYPPKCSIFFIHYSKGYSSQQNQ